MVPRIPSFIASAGAILALGLIGVLAGVPAGAEGESSPEAAVLADRLSLLRTAIFRFSMDHAGTAGAVYPGSAGEDPGLQLVGPSRSDGSVLERADGKEDRWFGPYLVEVPVNPVNGLNTIRVALRGTAEAEPCGEAGWLYLPESGQILADIPAAATAAP